MKFFAGAVVASMVALGNSAPVQLASNVIIVNPGNAQDIVITQQNTINATTPAPQRFNTSDSFSSDGTWLKTGKLPLALVSNVPGVASTAYITGLDTKERLVMLLPTGAFYYPSADANLATPQIVTADTAIPLGAQGSTTHISIPDYISSARIWVAQGDLKFYTVFNPSLGGPSLVEPSSANPSDPSAGVSWGFVELTNDEKEGLYANISSEGADEVDGYPWGDLCQVGKNGQTLRVLAPSDYVASNPSAFSDYWDDYNNQVWSKFTINQLTINTQAAAGKVQCRVSGDLINCDGDNRGYAKPTAGDIFGCNSGPFSILANDNEVHRAVVPRLCAAFNRGTLLMEGGHIQPGLSATKYYTSNPINWYSKFVHQYEMEGKGYAFSYDDVNPAIGVDQAGLVSDMEPKLLTITIGGPKSS